MNLILLLYFYLQKTLNLSYYFYEHGLNEYFYVNLDQNGIFPKYSVEEIGKMDSLENFLEKVIKIQWKETQRVYYRIIDIIKKLWKKAPWLSILILIITAYPLLIVFDFVIDWLLAKILLLTTIDRSPITISVKIETHYHKISEFEDATKIYLEKSLNYIWKRL